MTNPLRREPGFYRWMCLLAAPMVLQNLITTSLGFVDTFMVGLLGNAEMAAVNAANTPLYVVQVALFGFQSGMIVLGSQYWGRGDLKSINRVMGVALCAITGFTALIAAVLFCFPTAVMGLITPNETLIAIGAPYLRLVGIAYVFNGISSVCAGTQRSVENPKFGMLVMGVSMVLNTGLNYILIFGKCGAPALGVTGAAVATLTSRVAEFIISAVCTLRSRRVPIDMAALTHPGAGVWRNFLRYSAPVICNEALWSLGTSMLTVVLGHMENNQDMLAANALVGYVSKFSSVICFGLADAAAVMVGKEIGEGRDRQRVSSVGWALLWASFLVGVVTGGILLALVPAFFRPLLFPLFKLSPGAAYAATCMVTVLALVMPFHAFNSTNITGVLRAGGDVKVAITIDLIPLWCVAVPLSALTALVLKADVLWVCVAMYSENLCKMPLSVWRTRSGKWINDVTR